MAGGGLAPGLPLTRPRNKAERFSDVWAMFGPRGDLSSRGQIGSGGRLGPSAQSPYDRDANAEGIVAGALDSAGSGVRLQGRPEHGVPVDRPGHARRRSVRRRPAHGEDSCSRTGPPLCLSEASPLTRGDLGVVSPWRARGQWRVSDYRVLRPFAWEGQLYNPGQILRQSNPVEARIISEWPWPSRFPSAGTGTHRATRTRTPPAEAG